VAGPLLSRVTWALLKLLVLFRHGISKVRRSTATKFCTMVCSKQVQNFVGPSTKQNLRAKDAKIWRDFGRLQHLIANIFRINKNIQNQTSIFDSLYRDSFRIRRKKSGELWCTNYGDPEVKLYPPKSTFSESHYSAPIFSPNFTGAREWPSLTSASPAGDVGPSTFLYVRVKN